MELWSGDERRLSGDGVRCSLCLGSSPKPLESLDRRILYECFRIETAPSGAFLVCDECASLLSRTWAFFLRIKAAQLELRTVDVDDKSSIRAVADRIKVESPDIEDAENVGVSRTDEPLIEIHRASAARRKGAKKSAKEGEGEGKKYECPYCSERFGRMVERREHVSSLHAHEKKRRDRRIPHPRNAHGDEVECRVCGETFATHKALLEHANVHYPNFVCDVCGKVFATKAQIVKHRRYTHSLDSFACDLCGRRMKTREYLRNHVREVHRVGGDPRRSACPKCPERFKSHASRLDHLVRVHGDEPLRYKCKLCPNRYKLAGGLLVHTKRFHLNRRDHPCTHCGDSFFSKGELRDHALKHTGAKDFECDECGKRYGRKRALTGHMKSHAKEKAAPPPDAWAPAPPDVVQHF